MARKKNNPTEAELAVLRYLWENGESTTRELADALYPDSKRSQVTTVLKLLERLEEKSFVARDPSGSAVIFSAIIGRDDLIQLRLQDVADSLCDGSQAPLLMHLVQPQKLTRAERDILRNLVSEFENNSPRKKKKKK